MIFKKILLLSFLLISGCSQNINESDLNYNNNLWLSNNKPYSGDVYQLVKRKKIHLGRIEDGKKEKKWIEFGSLIWREGIYEKGNKIGSWNGWYSDSTKAFSGDYTQNLKDGLWSGWNIKGQLSYTGKYKNGKKDSTWIYLYENNQMSDSGEYKNDLMIGPWKYWYLNGVLMKEGNYNSTNGRESGVWIYYNTDGSIKEKKDHENY